MIYTIENKNVTIEADKIILGENIKFGNNIDIKVRDTFQIGNHSVIGDRFFARGENIKIGEYFFNMPTDNRGMNIGGGSSGFPFANLEIGDRCVCHTGHINLAKPVYIGNDVGLSHDCDIITHGFWSSILEGFPRKFAPVILHNNIIIGWKTVIMPGVIIFDNVVVGAHSTVIKNCLSNKIYGGIPAKEIKNIEPWNYEIQVQFLNDTIDEFNKLMEYYDVAPYKIKADMPNVIINDLIINVKDFTCSGKHDNLTDAFRDVLRRSGIRIFDPRGFIFNLKRK